MSAVDVTAPRQAEAGASVAGARGLYVLAIVELVWHLVFPLGMRFVPPAAFTKLPLFLNTTGLAFSVALFLLGRRFAVGRRGTAAESTAWALVAAAGFAAFVDLVSMAEHLVPSGFGIGTLGTVIGAVQMLMFVAVEITRWLALTRTSGGPVRTTPVFFTLLALTTVMWLYFLVYPFLRATWGLGDTVSVMALVGLVRLAVSVGRQLLVVLLLRRLVRDGAATAAPSTDAPLVAPQASALRDVAVGAAWLLGAILVTALSYAAVPAAGGRYVVATGAIVYGLVRLGRGLVRLGR